MKTSKDKNVYILIALLLIIAFIVSMIFNNTKSSTPYAIDNPGKNGTMALSEVLREKSTYIKTINRVSNIKNISSKEDSAIVVLNPHMIPDKKLKTIENNKVKDIIFINTANANLSNIQTTFSSSTKPITSDCTLDFLNYKTKISHSLFSLLPKNSSDSVSNTNLAVCFPIKGKEGTSYALIQKKNANNTLTYISDGSIFTNGQITKEGNAALALNILNKYKTVYWYLPYLEDFSSPEEKQTGVNALLPPGTYQLVILLAIATLFYLSGKSIRLGKVVEEDLPVIVKHEDIIFSKANLYRKSNDQEYTANILRRYYKKKLSKLLIINERSSLEEFTNALAKKTGSSITDLEKIFFTQPIRSNEELNILSLNLESIEKRVKDGKQ
ncbi:hypothetical protein HCQ94_02710 [Actinomyces sp. zg-332]|uniref:hypothetical protein n=1 Tax=Actinomyces sp. zg-332 TaxID=2708340 RepID=UPI00141D7867|nr:hypothetical protein [Actinomyces sp. zg-332]QPK94628.1 hypothetical protein HCQ94_02710 [Actinomyces sp. zg-332]